MSSSLSVGDVVDGRYEIRAALEQTPAYLAYRAFDPEVEVEVALWWMRIELFPTPTSMSSFVGAVVDLRGVKHANLRRMFEARQGPGYLYATAQLDTDDSRLLRPGTGRIATDADLVHYATSAAGALEAAHEVGHVHGRLVPTDVVQVAGLLKVGGAGLYRDVDPQAAAGCWRPYARYLSPEVRGGAMPTPASDVYSLARLLGELATGQTPDDTEVLIDQVEHHRPELANTLEAALSVAPHSRPETPAALLEAVRYGLIDERIPTGEAQALPASSSDVILLTRQVGGASTPRGKRSPGLGPRAGPHAKTMLEGQAVTPPGGVAVPGAGKTIADAVEVPAVRLPLDFAIEDEKTVDEGEARLAPFGMDPNADPERTMEDPEPQIPEIPLAQRVRDGVAVPRAVVAGEFDPDRTVEDRQPAGSVAAEQATPRQPRAPVRRSDPSIRFVSMKPKTEPNAKLKTPLVPAIDRPEMKPVLRPLSSLSSSGSYPPGTLGRYAPPRQVAAPPPRRAGRSLWLWVVLGAALAAAILFAVWFFALRSSGRAPDSRQPNPSSGTHETTPAPTTTPLSPARKPTGSAVAAPAPEKAACPEEMVRVAAEPPFCIDRYESPGKGRMPETGVSLAQAAATCRSRRARLCAELEWEVACRGEGDSSYPYGSSYRRDVCNTDASRSGAVAVAGEFAQCVSASGVFDMSGNVAEWVAEGTVRGGSALDRADGRCSRSRRVRGQQNHGFSDVGFRCCTGVGTTAP